MGFNSGFKGLKTNTSPEIYTDL